jgi:hypothetical protein
VEKGEKTTEQMEFLALGKYWDGQNLHFFFANPIRPLPPIPHFLHQCLLIGSLFQIVPRHKINLWFSL